MSPINTNPISPLKTHPLYPTWESLWNDVNKSVRVAPNSAQLLLWTLDGPLTSSILVKSSPGSPDEHELQPYYNKTTGVWHEVAKLPMTEPKVSSITVHVLELQEWENNWLELHEEHSDPKLGELWDGYIEWGPWEPSGGNGDNQAGEIDEGNLKLLKCCGIRRPEEKDVTLLVEAAGDRDDGFVTVHDYVTAVHPWLMGLRGEILGALASLDEVDGLAEDTPLTVTCVGDIVLVDKS